MLTPVVLEPSVIAEIARIGERRLPNEACGVIIPTPYKGRQVFEMPNRSKTPHDSFTMHSADIILELQDWAADNDEAVWEKMTIWHTHPGGNLDPSQSDIENRIEYCGNLVVALLEDGPRATWF